MNVNPYDTGYDENSHVMKFSSLAREVVTTAPTAISRALPKLKPGQKLRESVGQQKRVVSISDRKSTRLNSSHSGESRMPSSA